MVLKTYSCKDLQAILKIFKVNFVVVVVIRLTYGRIKLVISLNLLGNFGDTYN